MGEEEPNEGLEGNNVSKDLVSPGESIAVPTYSSLAYFKRGAPLLVMLMMSQPWSRKTWNIFVECSSIGARLTIWDPALLLDSTDTTLREPD